MSIQPVEEPRTHEPSEITYEEQFYPARPRSLRPRARLRGDAPSVREVAGDAVGTNPAYVEWLIERSMLRDAKVIAAQFSSSGAMWQNPYANPDPRRAIETASVWFTSYPISLVTRAGQSFVASLGDRELWRAFQQLGIDGIHTGPVKEAGGLDGWTLTPTVDGHFDRISTHLDPIFGTEHEFREMCHVAAEHGGTIIDDIVPGHTGKGADFRLAEMAVGEYPGIYHMVCIDRDDWHLLPDVPPGRDAVNLDAEREAALEAAGYIIGRLQRVIFYDPGVKDTNWSATGPVVGADGNTRRWVYLHYFKQGQPTINWLDPTFTGMQLVVGDALHSLADLGTGGLRLDANGFLGVEKSAEGPAWSEGHPLSEAANHLIASMVRKVGGFTFQELNLAIEDIKATGEVGADLSYDFVTRPAYHHALATQDTEFLRLVLNEARRVGVDPASLVHALQNHDELTYELVHFAVRHKETLFTFRGEEMTGDDLAHAIRADLCNTIAGDAAPYNLVFTTNGIASTTATVIAGALGHRDLADLSPESVAEIRRAHLLMAMFNALQPGVFSISGWDLCGMLTLDPGRISHLLATGDTRWIERPAYDLMGWNSDATFSASGMPVGTSLYGSLPEQLASPDSFANGLRRIIDVRRRYGIATGVQLDVPVAGHKSMLVLVHQLAHPRRAHVLALNFGTEAITGTVLSDTLTPGARVSDMFTGDFVADVDDLHSFSVSLPPHGGASFLVTAPLSAV